MLVCAVDLGTTNLKVIVYDERLRVLASASSPMVYDRRGDHVEFDPATLVDGVLALITECAAGAGGFEGHDVVIAVTGQAESLVLTDDAGDAVRPALSWLDERAVAEADELDRVFGADAAFAVTGEPFASTTWPAAKLAWLRRHEPHVLDAAAHVLMIKDHVVQRLTGVAVGEVTTRGFTYLWDVGRGDYWDDVLDHCGVRRETLPEVVSAGTDVGPVLPGVAGRLPSARGYRVNVGALDHFCAMVGTDSYRPGVVSESAGTVLSLSMLADDWSFDARRKVSFHTGLRAGETILFTGADSGGVALEWFRREGLAGLGWAELESALARRASVDRAAAPIFLPYLTGVAPPDFLTSARGAFLGLDLSHDRIDMAHAVEEGIAHLLRRNVDHLLPDRDAVTEIVSTGGGADSAVWSQLKADVCAVDVIVPDEREATCRGAAVLALVAAGVLTDLDDGARLDRPPVRRFAATRTAVHDHRYRLFEDYLERLYGARPSTDGDASPRLVRTETP